MGHAEGHCRDMQVGPQELGSARAGLQLALAKAKRLPAAVSLRRKADPDKPIYLHQLCTPSDIVLTSPAPREKCPELQARLAKLQEDLDNKR
jgi:hypothetical protein